MMHVAESDSQSSQRKPSRVAAHKVSLVGTAGLDTAPERLASGLRSFVVAYLARLRLPELPRTPWPPQRRRLAVPAGLLPAYFPIREECLPNLHGGHAYHCVE